MINPAHDPVSPPIRTSTATWNSRLTALTAMIPPVWIIGVIMLSTVMARAILRRRNVLEAAAFVLLSVAVAAIFARTNRPRPVTLIPLVGVVIAGGLSSFYAEDWARGAMQTALWGLTVLVFWIATRLDERQTERAVFAALAAIAVLAIYEVIGRWFVDGFVLSAIRRPESITPNTNNLAALMLPAFALAIKGRRWGWLGAFGLVLALTGSRASMVGALTGAGVLIIWLARRRFLWRMPSPRWAVAISAAAALVLIPLLALQGTQGSHGELAARVDLWRVGVITFAAHPLTGIGPENYEYGFARYSAMIHERMHHHAHSVPIQIAAEMGIVGVIALFALLAVIVRRLKDYRAARHPQYVIGAALAVALTVQGLVDYVYWVTINTLVVMLTGWALMTVPAEPRAPAKVTWIVTGVVLGIGLAAYFPLAQMDHWWPRWPLIALGAALSAALLVIEGRFARAIRERSVHEPPLQHESS